MNWDYLMNVVRRMLESSLTTVEIFCFTLLFSLPLGLLFTYGRMSSVKPIRWLSQAYLLVMRGTPLMLQLIFFFFCTDLSSIGFGRLQVAIVAFSLNYAAYFAEIYRGGIQSISVGQWEAANVLGFSRPQAFFRVILPQVIKRILPPMGNEFITLVKDTSLAQILGIVEITGLSFKMQSSSREATIIPILVAGVFYLIMNAVVAKCFDLAENKLSYYK